MEIGFIHRVLIESLVKINFSLLKRFQLDNANSTDKNTLNDFNVISYSKFTHEKCL